jgi:hypothetical protein
MSSSPRGGNARRKAASVRLPSAHAGLTMTWGSRPGWAAGGDWAGVDAALRSGLSFASCYVYAPQGQGLLSAAARLLCQRVKASDPRWLPRYAGQIVELWAREGLFQQLFSRDAWLVPVPGCTPSCAQSTAAFQLARALRELGLASGVWPGIVRRTPVAKSSTARLGERPTVRQHYESFAVVEAPASPVHKIILVDDVITKGRTVLAAATRLRRELAHTDVRAFALVRTLGFVTHVERLLAPCHGVVYWSGGDARREP